MQKFSDTQLCLLRMPCALLPILITVTMLTRYMSGTILAMMWATFWLVSMVAKHSVLVGFLPPSYVLEGMSCCNTYTTSSPRHKKGDPKDCNNWRGLYVGDHTSKIISSVLAQQLIPSYVKFVNATQDSVYTEVTLSKLPVSVELIVVTFHVLAICSVFRVVTFQTLLARRALQLFLLAPSSLLLLLHTCSRLPQSSVLPSNVFGLPFSFLFSFSSSNSDI